MQRVRSKSLETRASARPCPALVLSQPCTSGSAALHFFKKSAGQACKAVLTLRALLTIKVQSMARTYKPKSDLSKLPYSPLVNPLVEPQQLRTKRRLVRSGRSEDLVNPATGEIAGVAAIHQIEERDDAEFVKVFAEGVAAGYELTKTAQRVFQVVLDQYQRTPMSRGYADAVNLFWFDDGIEGRAVGISEYTFKRGLRELLDKGFLHPKDSASFWVNPALFFKGDRVLFIKEYRRRKPTQQDELEAIGQQRLDIET